MGLYKDKLVYDTTTPGDADQVSAYLRTEGGALTSTLVGSDESLDVAAYLRDDTGTLFTGTTVGSDHGLDVNILNDLTVDADGDYDVSANPTPDSIGMIAHDRGATPDETAQNQRPTAAAPTSDDITAANVHALDTNGFLHGFDGSTWDRLLATDGALDSHIKSIESGVTFPVVGGVADDAADSGNPIKVGSRAVDSALTELSAADDRADLLSDLYRRVYINDAPNIALGYGAATVGTTAAELVAANSGRRRILVQNLSSKPVFLGGDNSVTTSNGLRVARGAMLEIPLGEHVALHAIGEAAGQDVRYIQLA